MRNTIEKMNIWSLWYSTRTPTVTRTMSSFELQFQRIWSLSSTPKSHELLLLHSVPSLTATVSITSSESIMYSLEDSFKYSNGRPLFDCYSTPARKTYWVFFYHPLHLRTLHHKHPLFRSLVTRVFFYLQLLRSRTRRRTALLHHQVNQKFLLSVSFVNPAITDTPSRTQTSSISYELIYSNYHEYSNTHGHRFYFTFIFCLVSWIIIKYSFKKISDFYFSFLLDIPPLVLFILLLDHKYLLLLLLSNSATPSRATSPSPLMTANASVTLLH